MGMGGGRQRYGERYGIGERTENKESGREAERQHICQNSSKTLGEAEKAAGSCSRSRWSECARGKKGGLMGSKVREALLLSPSQREGESERESVCVQGGGGLLFMCVR